MPDTLTETDQPTGLKQVSTFLPILCTPTPRAPVTPRSITKTHRVASQNDCNTEESISRGFVHTKFLSNQPSRRYRHRSRTDGRRKSNANISGTAATILVCKASKLIPEPDESNHYIHHPPRPTVPTLDLEKRHPHADSGRQQSNRWNHSLQLQETTVAAAQKILQLQQCRSHRRTPGPRLPARKRSPRCGNNHLLHQVNRGSCVITIQLILGTT